jgi:hypothetical protein
MPGNKYPASSQNIGRFHYLGEYMKRATVEKGEDATRRETEIIKELFSDVSQHLS